MTNKKIERTLAVTLVRVWRAKGPASSLWITRYWASSRLSWKHDGQDSDGRVLSLW